MQLFLLGIIAYVGTEQSLADWMSQFLSTYHHFSPEREGAHAVGLFWGLMSIGCVLGMALLRLLDAKLVLAVFTTLALGCVGLALFGILCTGILGGAVVPLLVGMLGDRLGLRLAMLAVFVTLGFILSIAFWARPLIRNETVGVLELFSLRRRSNAHD